MKKLLLMLLNYGCQPFPLAKGSKCPPKGLSWKEYITNESEIESSRDENWALKTGKASGVVILDFDDRLGLKWFQDRFGLSSPRMTATPRGGFHVWTAYPDMEVRNYVKIHGQAIDIRGDGGYVVLPGSIVNGKEYIALGDWYAPLPPFKLEWLPPAKVTPATMPSAARASTTGHIKNIRAYCRAILSLQGHNGNRAMMKVCHKLADHFGNYDSALAELLIWNSSGAADPPWPIEPDLTRALRKAFAMKGVSA